LLAALAVKGGERRYDVSHPCPDIAFAEHDLAASFEYTVGFEGFGVIRTY
jgi:hypothetical protein